jgi:hypothetical protein
MESIQFSPDAKRHGGFSIPQELVANEWRSPPLPSRTLLFASEPRNTCACPPNTKQYSPENQLDVIRKYAAAHQMEVVREYSDFGRSGLNIAGCEGLNQLM